MLTLTFTDPMQLSLLLPLPRHKLCNTKLHKTGIKALGACTSTLDTDPNTQPVWIQTLVIKLPSQHSGKPPPPTQGIQLLKPTIFSANTTVQIPSTEMSRKLNRHERSVIRVREKGASQSRYFPLETPTRQTQGSPPHTRQGEWVREIQREGSWYLNPHCPSPLVAATGVAARLPPWAPRVPSPYLLRFSWARCQPACAGQQGAGTQKGVMTAPQAASLCSSWSREGLRHQGALALPPSPRPVPTGQRGVWQGLLSTPHAELPLQVSAVPPCHSVGSSQTWEPTSGLTSLQLGFILPWLPARVCIPLHPLPGLDQTLLWGIPSPLDYRNDAPNPVACCTKQG